MLNLSGLRFFPDEFSTSFELSLAVVVCSPTSSGNRESFDCEHSISSVVCQMIFANGWVKLLIFRKW